MLLLEKYRPENLEDMILQDHIREMFSQFISSKDFPNLIIHGTAGVGKTSLVNTLKKQLNLEDLVLNGSEARGIDVIREQVIPFTQTLAFSNTKLVDIREAEEMTPNAQKALKDVIESCYDNVRFIFTTNNIYKIIPEIQSRCQIIHLEAPEKTVVQRFIYNILKKENIKITNPKESIPAFVDEFYPDIRKCVGALQLSIQKGEFQHVKKDFFDNSTNVDIFNELVNILKFRKEVRFDNIKTIGERLSYLSDREISELFSYIYRKVDNIKDISNMNKAIIKLMVADFTYKSYFMNDKFMNIYAMFINICKEID